LFEFAGFWDRHRVTGHSSGSAHDGTNNPNSYDS
jgi:hypothetical protein